MIYGQYPAAEITEVEDYALDFDAEDVENSFDMYGTEVVLVQDDIYPIRTYHEYEDALAEDDRFIDPHQSLVEAFTNINEGEQFWVQILVKPVDGGRTADWQGVGEKKINEISGREEKSAGGFASAFIEPILTIPTELFRVLTTGTAETADADDDKQLFRFLNPLEEEVTKGIFRKTSRTGFKTKIRLVHISPPGQLHKPNVGKAIGVFKQFSATHLNSFKPDPLTKSNGPNYILKASRRKFRKRFNLYNYQWRDFFGGEEQGYMMTAEELATLYHFPAKYVRTPSLRRATSGLGSAPSNLPYV